MKEPFLNKSFETLALFSGRLFFGIFLLNLLSLSDYIPFYISYWDRLDIFVLSSILMLVLVFMLFIFQFKYLKPLVNNVIKVRLFASLILFFSVFIIALMGSFFNFYFYPEEVGIIFLIIGIVIVFFLVTLFKKISNKKDALKIVESFFYLILGLMFWSVFVGLISYSLLLVFI